MLPPLFAQFLQLLMVLELCEIRAVDLYAAGQKDLPVHHARAVDPAQLRHVRDERQRDAVDMRIDIIIVTDIRADVVEQLFQPIADADGRGALLQAEKGQNFRLFGRARTPPAIPL